MMRSLQHRSTEEEIMDDLACQGEVVDQTLRELDFINKWLGGNPVTLKPLNKILSLHHGQNLTIVDLGCGSGEMLRIIQRRHADKALKLIGIDANPNITHFAQQHSAAYSNITYETTDVLSEVFQSRHFDVVLATLFLHHFTHAQLVRLLSSLHRQTQKAIIINDLHRHPLAYLSIRWLTRWFSKSSMVQFDAPLSVARGFKKNEWLAILKEAGITHYTLKWKWAFRWQLVVYCAPQQKMTSLAQF